MIKYVALALVAVSLLPACSQPQTKYGSDVKSDTYTPLVKCEGLTMDVGSRFGRKQLVINNVNGAFNNLANYGNLWQATNYMIAKWDYNELVLREFRVKWNSEFASYFANVLVTADRENDKVRVKVYSASLLNEDDGVVLPSSIQFRIDHVFNNCRSL